MLGLSASTLRRWADAGVVRSYVTPGGHRRFSRTGVQALLPRRDAILTSIISQVTPSESSLIKRVALEPMMLTHLTNTLGIRGVKKVSMHEPLTNLRKVLVLVCDRNMPTTEIWRAMYGAAALHRAAGKYIIAVNDDIDPDNADALKDFLDGRDLIDLLLRYPGVIRSAEDVIALVPRLAHTIYTVKKRSRGINYGANRVRFTGPVPAGSRIRLRQKIKSVEPVGGGVRVTSESTMEVEGAARPALVAETISMTFD